MSPVHDPSYAHWSVVEEAQDAGRDVTAFAAAWWDWADRRCDGRPSTKAQASVVKRWVEVCAVSREEARLCRDVMSQWIDDAAEKSPERRRRARHVAHVCGRINRGMTWYPGVAERRHTLHWEAMRLRRWVHLMGLDAQLSERYLRKAEQAEMRKAKTAERRLREALDVDTTGAL